MSEHGVSALWKDIDIHAGAHYIHCTALHISWEVCLHHSLGAADTMFPAMLQRLAIRKGSPVEGSPSGNMPSLRHS